MLQKTGLLSHWLQLKSCVKNGARPVLKTVELVVVVGEEKLKRVTGRTVSFYALEDRFTQSLASNHQLCEDGGKTGTFSSRWNHPNRAT